MDITSSATTFIASTDFFVWGYRLSYKGVLHVDDESATTIQELFVSQDS